MNNDTVLQIQRKIKNVLFVLSRCHPGTFGDSGVRLLQFQLGEGSHQPQRHRALLWRERQAAALFRNVEERLRHSGDRQARLLAGRRQLLRQVCGKQQKSKVVLVLVVTFGPFHPVLFQCFTQKIVLPILFTRHSWTAAHFEFKNFPQLFSVRIDGFSIF